MRFIYVISNIMINKTTSINTQRKLQENAAISASNNLENLRILSKEVEHDVFDSFIQSIWDEKEKNELIFSEFLNNEKISPLHLWDIRTWIWDINKEINMSKEMQYLISKIFIKKLYKSGGNDDNFLDTFSTDFWDIEKKWIKNIDLKSLSKLISNYDEKYTNNLSISNAEIFWEIGNVSMLYTLDKQNPSVQKKVCELLNWELCDTINKFKEKKWELHSWLESLLTPNKNRIHDLESFKDDPDMDFRKIVDKLKNNNFNFELLDNQEKTKLAHKSIDWDGKNKNLFAKVRWIDMDDFNKFLNNLYDFDRQWETISISDNPPINIKVTKNFENGEHEWLKNVENMEDMDSLPFVFTINIDDNSPEIIDELEDINNVVLSRELNVNGLISTYDTKSWKLRIWNKYLLDIWWVQITADILDEISNLEKEEVPNALKKYGLWEVWWKKFEQINSNDTIYIFDQLIKDSDIKILKRDLEFAWKNINKLSQLYLLSGQYQEKNLINDEDPVEFDLDEEMRSTEEVCEKARSVANDISEDYEDWVGETDDWDSGSDDGGDSGDSDDTDDWVGDAYEVSDSIVDDVRTYCDSLSDDDRTSFFDDLERDLIGDGILDAETITNVLNKLKSSITESEPWDTWHDWDGPESSEIAEDADRAFESAWNSIEWSPDTKFELGSRIMIKTPTSKLPPDDKKDSFFIFEVCDISWEPGTGTFSLRAIWNEVPLASPGKVYDWLPYNAEQLEKMKKSGTLYKLDKKTSNSRAACKKTIMDCKAISTFNSFGDMSNQVQLAWNKFVDKDGKEVKYFSRSPEIYDDESNRPWREIVKYEVKNVDPVNGTVTLYSTFEWVDDDSWTLNMANYRYEHTLPFELFMLFVESKNLKWYANVSDDKYTCEKQWRHSRRWLFRRVSIWNFVSIFKKWWKTIKDKLKERQEDQEEHLENFLLSREWLNLYKHMWKIMSLWWLLWDVETAFYAAELEYFNNRDEKIWKKIDEWYKRFNNDPMYPALFASDLEAMFAKKGQRLGDKNRYRFAAAVLIMLKKEWPYPRSLQWKLLEWSWVEAILWTLHKERFMNKFYKKKKTNINESKDMWYPSSIMTEQMEELNKLEFQYIIGVIGGDEPYKFDDSDFQKSVWSNKFKDELQKNMDEYFNKHESVKSDLKWKSFEAASITFMDQMEKWNYVKILASLEYMCEKASNTTEIFLLKWYIMSAMLMWITNRTSSSTMNSLWQTARAMWFYPLFCRAKKPDSAEKVQKLLDWLSRLDPKIQSFSSVTGFDLQSFSDPGISRKFGEFNKVFQNYRKINGHEILNYIENPEYGGAHSINKIANQKEDPLYPICSDLKKAYEDQDLWNINGNVKSIRYIKEAPLTASYNIVRKYMPNSGAYKLEKEEDLWDARDLWTAIANKVNQGAHNNENVEFYMKYYDKLFDLSQVDKWDLIRTISLIKELKHAWRNEEAKYIWWYMFEWKMHENVRWDFPTEFQKCHDAFSDFFYKSIDNMDKNTMKRVFGTWSDEDFLMPYKMVSRYDWNHNIWIGDNSTSRTSRNFNSAIKERWFTENDTINYKIKTLRRGISKTCKVKKASIDLLNSRYNFNFAYLDGRDPVLDARECDPTNYPTV